MQRFDSQKVSDLQGIQWQIINYYQTKSVLPQTLAEARDPLSGEMIPKDPQTGAEYGYRVINPPYTFELCAVFNEESVVNPNVSKPVPAGSGLDNETWAHGAGETCFERTIDPERYPPYPKTR
jgi:hypothetical protein